MKRCRPPVPSPLSPPHSVSLLPPLLWVLLISQANYSSPSPPWQLLNLPSYTILSIPSRLVRQYGISPRWLEENLGPYLMQTRGKEKLVRRYCERGDDGGYVEPDYLIASTRHYSWPKGACTSFSPRRHTHTPPHFIILFLLSH